MYFKEFSCKITENMQARCVPRFIQCFLRSRKTKPSGSSEALPTSTLSVSETVLLASAVIAIPP